MSVYGRFLGVYNKPGRVLQVSDIFKASNEAIDYLKIIMESNQFVVLNERVSSWG